MVKLLILLQKLIQVARSPGLSKTGPDVTFKLTPSSFGEFDSDSGIWKPKDVSGLTCGTNGFYLDFKDSSNLGNDA